MTDDLAPTRPNLSGALIGWKRRSSRHGIMMTLQIAENEAHYRKHDFHHVVMALNDRQLRSLTRDLTRAAHARGLDLRSRRPLHSRLWTGLRTALAGR